MNTSIKQLGKGRERHVYSEQTCSLTYDVAYHGIFSSVQSSGSIVQQRHPFPSHSALTATTLHRPLSLSFKCCGNRLSHQPIYVNGRR
jgi:hypothetical protein